MKKISLFLIITIIIIFLVNSNVFAIDVVVNNETISLPDLPTLDNTYSDKFFIYNEGTLYTLVVLLSDNGNAYYQTNYSRLRAVNCSTYEYNSATNNFIWGNKRDLGGTNIYVMPLLSNFDIYYQNTTDIYFSNNYIETTPTPQVFSNDTLYIGDIPLSFEYAQFSSDYVDLFSQSSCNANDDLQYYRIYFIDNAFYYDTGTAHFDNATNFQKINVSDKFYYRRDFPNIVLTTFIICIFFLWLTNLFTSIIYKGGILRGLF